MITRKQLTMAETPTISNEKDFFINFWTIQIKKPAYKIPAENESFWGGFQSMETPVVEFWEMISTIIAHATG